MTSPAASNAPTTSGLAPFSTLAIVAFVFAFVFFPVGIITGHIALARIGRTGERGRGLALAAVIIGYAWLIIDVILFATGHLHFYAFTR
ncbi:uncharacterized protein DUF4190 [Frondihabitans sp. PhB188]|uniref:DUF4190 domain-containing protein n=1 Tax=Frondihabitans sp. PhB188 TaxID=2485200 RepID=UPI000F47E99E|nr:DUF4190 domain-containing protein [Frondihabitans sp. PhB188]ROQ31006.1 uncharacterized protein DUF4190 [Frondihabitans sp. PhB188]